ncbi:MAG: hypothetical protein P1R58_07465 [bacterium]|nr:hypothetical protein [bacterium]
MRGLIQHTISELFDRKLVYAFALVTLVAVLLVLFSTTIDISFGGEEQDLGDLSQAMGDTFLKGLSMFLSFLVFLAVMGTAGLIPTMLSPGQSDYFLSKPLSRTRLMLSKFCSIFSVYGAVIVVCGAVVWLAMSVSYLGFSGAIFYLFLSHLISLFIWLSITALAGVMSNSSAMSIMAAFTVWVLKVVVSSARAFEDVLGSKLLKFFLDALYQILPKTDQIETIGERLTSDLFIASYSAVWTSLLFAVVLLFLTVVTFNRRSY